MHQSVLLTTALFSILVSARPNHVRRGIQCDFETVPSSGATCASFADSWGLNVKQLRELNPDIICPRLDTTKSYCVSGTVDDTSSSSALPPSTTLQTSTVTKTSATASASSTATATSTPQPSSTVKPSTTLKPSTTTSKAPTNSPTMPGIVADCDGFHKVVSGDQCDIIAKKYGITSSQFLSWNREINAECTNLWLDYYVCIHAPSTPTTPTPSSKPPSPTTTPPPTGPTPQMPGIIANCKKYYQVKEGDNCWSIYTNAGITLEKFLSWNKEVDSGCSNLWLGYYVCVGV